MTAFEATIKACDWPDQEFKFADEPGEHDPCYVVMPGGSMLPVNHHAGKGVDEYRALFIIAACNEKLERMRRGEDGMLSEGAGTGFMEARDLLASIRDELAEHRRLVSNPLLVAKTISIALEKWAPR